MSNMLDLLLIAGIALLGLVLATLPGQRSD